VRRAVAIPLAVLALVAVVAGLGVLFMTGGDGGDGGSRDDRRRLRAEPSPSASEVAATTASATPTASASASAPGSASASPSASPTRSATRPAAAACAPTARAPFGPHHITVPGVTHDADVVRPAREDGVPGTPPLTTYGKTVFAYDLAQGVQPGDAGGNVLLNAHTWPDGTALGNHLLAGLDEGDKIVVQGAGAARLCYRVTERVEVLARKGLARYYEQDGPPQLAIVVCSGRRLGPGVWEKRTIWFASPTA
jgi:hypothetical protein